jgi:hypothetical protein
VDHSLPRLLLCTAVCASFLSLFFHFFLVVFIYFYFAALELMGPVVRDTTDQTWIAFLINSVRLLLLLLCGTSHEIKSIHSYAPEYISQLKKGIAEIAGGARFFSFFKRLFSFSFSYSGRKKLAMTFRSENSANFHKVSE